MTQRHLITALFGVLGPLLVMTYFPAPDSNLAAGSVLASVAYLCGWIGWRLAR